MAEFKAQILGILIVISVFGVLLGLYEGMAKDTLENVSQQVSEIVESPSGS